MKILCTTSRMPFAVDEIRKLGQQGHEVYAADTFRTAPGSHSAEVHQRVVVPAPKQDTSAFVQAVVDLCTNGGIELIVPMFEDVFYLAKHRDQLPATTRLFCPSFDTLATVHDKASFLQLCERIGVPVPATVVATTDEELRTAVDSFPEYFARAAYSRGGVELLTNTGPLAGTVSLDEVHPTPDNPWVVQAFVEGKDLCSFSIVHGGKVTAHCTYEHPRTIEHAGGIEFVSVDEPRTLELAQKIAAETGYDGQVSFDWLVHDDGTISVVECNPRPTDGVTLMDAGVFATALLDPGPDVAVVAPGRMSEIKFAMLRDMFREPSNLPQDLRELFEAPDVYHGEHDLKPFLYEVLSYSHVFAFRHHEHPHAHKHTDLVAAQFFDVEWDGSPIA
jgi:predicted ATP-grasp superfamily ATP-dependent carboligase